MSVFGRFDIQPAPLPVLCSNIAFLQELPGLKHPRKDYFELTKDNKYWTSTEVLTFELRPLTPCLVGEWQYFIIEIITFKMYDRIESRSDDQTLGFIIFSSSV